jgi:SAM-dependent methyltransferase
MEDNQMFAFGRNWQLFLRSIDDERVAVARQSLTEFMDLPDLKGKTFLDVGCGSGLFSYAAFTLAAERIVSFDLDPFSVECCRYMRSKANELDRWDVLSGSILDEAFIATLGTFDVVYAWGVLHHTGRMWDAIAHAARLVKPGGYLYLALYNKVAGRNGSASWIHSFWLSVKKLYNAYPKVGMYVLEPLAMSAYVAMVLARGENPVTHVQNYRSNRGMSWHTDARDWLGGYPYEFATVEEVFTFVKREFPDFNLVNLKTTSGRGLNWFLFQRQ